jgi:hypothetical protein
LDDDGPLCDRCFDDRVSASMGMPKLPDVPEPVVITGPDGCRHVLRYRIWRAPTGIAVELREDGVPAGEGFEFGVLGDHDADVAALAARVRAEAEAEIGRRYLEPGPGGAGWRLAGGEVAGRLIWGPDGGPYRVVVDGRPLSWAQFGEALESFEGWRFRLVIDDPCVDVRSDAEVLAFRRPVGDAD